MCFYSWEGGFSTSEHPPSFWPWLWEGPMDSVLACPLHSLQVWCALRQMEPFLTNLTTCLPDSPAWSSEAPGLDPGFTRIPGRVTWLYWISLSSSANRTHSTGLWSAYLSLVLCKSSVKTGIIYTHFRDVISERMGHNEPVDKNKQEDDFITESYFENYGASLPQVSEQVSHWKFNFQKRSLWFRRYKYEFKTRWKGVPWWFSV